MMIHCWERYKHDRLGLCLSLIFLSSIFFRLCSVPTVATTARWKMSVVPKAETVLQHTTNSTMSPSEGAKAQASNHEEEEDPPARRPAAAGGEEQQQDNLQEFLYYNLSCPMEWSKYSCAHQQDNMDAALAGRNFTLHHQKDILKSYQNIAPQDGSRLVLMGDSLTRQIFISIACLLDGLQLQHKYKYNNSSTSTTVAVVAETRANWSLKWPCHGTSNCIREGNHSGFTVASIRFVNGAEIHFLLLGGSSVKRMIQELLSSSSSIDHDDDGTPPGGVGFVTMRNGTALQSSRPLRLSRNDTLLINVGIHNRLKDIPSRVRQVNELGYLLHRRRGDHRRHATKEEEAANINNNNTNNSTLNHDPHVPSGPHLGDDDDDIGNPLLWYMTTPTQHFRSRTGQYDVNQKGIHNGCVETLPENPRARQEVELLVSPNAIDRIFHYDDLHLGGMHIGNKDCSHYCMPGPPDRIAASIYRAWAAKKLID